jgi:hypothetical protein
MNHTATQELEKKKVVENLERIYRQNKQFNRDILQCIHHIFLEKVHIPSNYHSIVNVPPKLPIVSMSPPPKPQKNINVPPKANTKTKITLKKFQ